jgi:hypothetical protein
LLASEGSSWPFNWTPTFTAKSIVALAFEQSNVTLFYKGHSQLIVNFCVQNLAVNQDIKSAANIFGKTAYSSDLDGAQNAQNNL